jgi:acyl-homoserine lactone acylase PvdQ
VPSIGNVPPRIVTFTWPQGTPDDGPEQSNGQIVDNDGWGHLMIVMESEPKEIWSLLPFGESDDPSSPHYNDQTKLHSRREINQFWFSPEQIRDHTESVWGDSGRLGRDFGCGQPAGPQHMSGKPDLNSAACP